MTIKLRFEEPPTPGGGAARGSKKYRRAVEQLKKRPGEWAIVAVCKNHQASNSLSYQIKNGKSAAFLPKGHFDAVARLVGKEHRVYARYVGEGTP